MRAALFAVLGAIFALNFIHAVFLTGRFFEACNILLRLRFNEPESSPRLARFYSVANGLITLAIFPFYWVIAISCHRWYNGDWVKWAENEKSRPLPK